MSTISGTASDFSGNGGTSQLPADSGVKNVYVAISSGTGLNQWWSGTGFNTQTAPLWTQVTYTGAASGTWSYAVGLPTPGPSGWQSGQYYIVLASATDNANNQQPASVLG